MDFIRISSVFSVADIKTAAAAITLPKICWRRKVSIWLSDYSLLSREAWVGKRRQDLKQRLKRSIACWLASHNLFPYLAYSRPICPMVALLTIK